jgi:hypothetical protein
MSISINKYIDITSGVGGASAVANRQLIGRYITTSSLLLPGELVEFDSIDDVGTRFPETSPEYIAASKYFAFVSKMNTGARRLSMYAWSKTAAAPQVVGAPGILGNAVLTSLKACTAISFNVTDTNNVVTPVNITGMDLSAATSFEDIRADVQTALRANANPQLVNATVLYTAATGVFTIQGSVSGSGNLIEVVPTATPGTDFGSQAALATASGGKAVPGVSAQTPLQAVQDSAALSDNFGSFGFIDSSTSPPTPLPDADIAAVSAWNAAQNVKYLYCLPGTIATAPNLYAALKGNAGTALTISVPNGADWAEFEPMEILAATDYSRPNSSQNYMFYEFNNRVATVTDTQTSDAMDLVRANYNGQVMRAGRQFSFYQRGVLMGGKTAPLDINTYTNEIWLKDDITTNILNAFLGLPRIPANDTGRGLVLSNIQPSIDAAINNGTISVGKLLTPQQKQYVTQITNDPNAWQQIQNIGYWIDVEILSYQTPDGRTEYKAVYVLVYSKDDQIRKVEGSDVLI